MVDIERILNDVADGTIDVSEGLRQIEGFTRVDDFARIDTLRRGRKTIPEVVLSEGKQAHHVVKIVEEFLADESHVIVSRTDESTRAALETIDAAVTHYEASDMMVFQTDTYSPPPTEGSIAVLSGGTGDIPVAEEAVVIATEMGCDVETFYDVGVAGIHRLLGELDDLNAFDCVVVAAGREGALPTVVAGLVDTPVIGLPVSIGYGYGSDGESALMSMLQSCSVMSVVNIDAGFVAGAQAAQIART